MNKTEVDTKSKTFAIDVIKLTSQLSAIPALAHLSKMLIKSSANMGVHNFIASESPLTDEFISEISQAIRYGKKSLYLLQLFNDSGLLPESIMTLPLINEAQQLIETYTDMQNNAIQKRLDRL